MDEENQAQEGKVTQVETCQVLQLHCCPGGPREQKEGLPRGLGTSVCGQEPEGGHQGGDMSQWNPRDKKHSEQEQRKRIPQGSLRGDCQGGVETGNRVVSWMPGKRVRSVGSDSGRVIQGLLSVHRT